MKNNKNSLFSLLMIILLLISVSACKNESDEEPVEGTNTGGGNNRQGYG
jgi:hypothetical protein